ncbi:MAG: radical SAM family heme chaperone HemW [Oscillospiraceae bacterium]|nr:radical SAM family heme chaperone HemW [Oscillospiraceae bacterium]
MTGLYFHIPFCARKCPYCDFYSVPFHKETVSRYVGAILRNITAHPITDKIDTVYFGGGTPSLLSPAQIGEILDACTGAYTLAEDTEITLEFNPTGRRDDYLKALRSAGVNRLSIGTQSFSDAQLRLLGRTHSAQDGLHAVEAAQTAGFVNISCDLMLATPEQSEEVLAQTLDVLAALPITHVSAYMLQIEEGTPLSQDTALLSRCPDDDATADRYLQAVHALAAAGFRQYEVSSFAKPGFKSRHNLKYWRCEPYLGIGAGAHSCCGESPLTGASQCAANGAKVGGEPPLAGAAQCAAGITRFCVPKDVQAFLDADRQPEELLDAHPLEREERLMLALRLTDGVPASALSDAARKQIPALLHAGYLRLNGAGIALTPKGFAVSNAVIAALIV